MNYKNVQQRQLNTQTTSINSNDSTTHKLQECTATTTKHIHYKYLQQRQHIYNQQQHIKKTTTENMRTTKTPQLGEKTHEVNNKHTCNMHMFNEIRL